MEKIINKGGRPRKQAPGLGKVELGKMLDISLSCHSSLKDAQDFHKELYNIILNLDAAKDINEVKETVVKLRQEGQFMGLMIEGAISSVEYVINRNRYLTAYVEHKQLLWEEAKKNL